MTKPAEARKRRSRMTSPLKAVVGGAALLVASPAIGAAVSAPAADAQAAPTGGCSATFTSTTPVVGVASPRTAGYWEVDQAGQVAAIGGAACYGSAANLHLSQPIVGMAATPDGGGYWLVAADGGIFSFGDAHFYGSMGNQRLDQSVVGMAPTPDGHGYWLVARDGGIFSFGDAVFHGSMGNKALDSPVVGMAPDPTTGGYWMVAGDGGIFAFDSPFHGSAGATAIPAPATAISATAGGAGYRIVLADGHILDYGNANYAGQATLPAGTQLRCLSSQITAYDAGSLGGVGNVAQAIGLTNTSKIACTMDGYPGAALLGDNDAALPVTTVRGPDYLFGDPGPSSQTVAPGQDVFFDLGYTDMNLGQPASNRIEYILPNGTNPVFFSLSGVAYAYPNPDHVNVNAVHPAPAFVP